MAADALVTSGEGDGIRTHDPCLHSTPGAVCADLIFGRNGAVYMKGERFTYVDCDNATEPALSETNHDAYRFAV